MIGMTKKTALLIILLAAVSLVGFAQTNATAPPVVVLTYTNIVLARSDVWTCSGLELKPGDAATLTASGEWSIGRLCDSGGIGIPARPDWQPTLPGVNLGCLVVSIERSPNDADIQPFKGNKFPIYVEKPGKFCFMANDYHHPDTGAGFADNTGALVVTIKIQTAHPEHYPPQP
jgi:hypothetical protein